MNYSGKLYGKINRTYIPLIMTSNDVDQLERERNQAIAERDELKNLIAAVADRIGDEVDGMWGRSIMRRVDEICE